MKPECEVFDSGHLWFVNQIHKEGLLSEPPLVQLCMGIPGGAPADVKLTACMADMLPPSAVFSGFAISRNEMPFVGLMPLIGGNVRVGLEVGWARQRRAVLGWRYSSQQHLPRRNYISRRLSKKQHF